MAYHKWQQNLSSFLALFTSSGTLICCAIPALVATVAGGAAVSSMISTMPWLVSFSQYKEWIFLIAGIMTALSGLLIFFPKGKVACSITGGQGCDVAGRYTKALFWLSVTMITIGAFFAYGYYPILRVLEGL
ncbi:hypothetical protein [Gracilimonas sediminicola]|uniref:Mercuric transport protein MerT n=1 Tax=Gracilimonas sediminicola TaxID=2952158 RepID=A0A9X2L1E5_9BACT|nr:hypothetical protein [Gracilimonas sediminicola]MCP9290551.1 hypothetical protein [Gracilimonas sediminicola]